MSQPELGKRLTEIRKQRGLTQEELVAKCNVTVRTIQRIEAGEVTPRPSTLKLIVEALEYDWNAFTHQVSPAESENFSDGDGGWTNKIFLLNAANLPAQDAQRYVQYAWIAGILYFILGFPESLVEMSISSPFTMEIDHSVYVVLKVLVMITFVFFIRGFIIIGQRERKAILTLGSYIYLLVVILDYSMDIFMATPVSEEAIGARLIGKSIMYGFTALVFGIGLLRIEEVSGRAAIVGGFIEIAIGILFISVILFMGGLILLVPAEIIEIYILFKYVSRVSNSRMNYQLEDLKI